MNRTLQIKLAVIVVAILGSLYSLWPSIRLAQGTEGMAEEAVENLRDRAIRRGLDLAGGMYLVLEVDRSQLEDTEASDALDRVIQILRNRVDQFGVSEPVIQKEAGSRIVVQLPGLQDPVRAKRLIGSTARLEFRMVRESSEVTTLVNRIDRIISGAGIDSVDIAESDTTAAAEDDTLGSDLLAGLPEEAASQEIDSERPFTTLIGPYLPEFGAIPVADRNRTTIESFLAREDVGRILPRGATFLWGVEKFQAEGGGTASLLYLVDDSVSLAGDEIENAVVAPDPDRPPLLMVSLDLTRRGGLKFANVTGANVGRKLAIVLDGTVHTAPVIRTKITGGRASISGGFATDAEARDLALMLRAGALPADVRIEEERTVGPSLGMDSIRQGVRSSLIGALIVVVFMIIYYRVSGLLATLGLTVTMLILLGILATLGLTLTLPGLAGVVLTVGMAVDANVLIFERIREELRHGKSVRVAIDSGFAQAARAIIDANITTLIAAFVLFYFGTGPVKGFAVTLSIGVIASMFSALIFTRTIYDLWLTGRQPKSLSI